MKFTKMHGNGNDFIVINCFEEEIDFEPGRLAELCCNRNFGIGADGLLLISPSDVADFKMSVYNPDGSKAEMCANALRCLAKLVYDHHQTNMTAISVETLDGIKTLIMSVKDERMKTASVDIGVPILRSNGTEVPLNGKVNFNREDIVETLAIGEQSLRIVFMNIGEPQVIAFANDLSNVPFEKICPLIETHIRFPERTNVSFIENVSENEIKMRTHKRGTGEVLSCGNAAAAAVAASYALGRSGKEATVSFPGGSIMVNISDEGRMIVTGTATEVFSGEMRFI